MEALDESKPTSNHLPNEEEETILPTEEEEDEHREEEENEEITKRSRPSVTAAKVVKKPSSKWLVYLSEQRLSLAAEQPSLSVAQLTKTVAERYKTLSAEEHARLEAIVQAQKEAYEAYLQSLENDDNNDNNDKNNAHHTISESIVMSPTQLVLPLARIKRTMKLDPETKTVSKEALLATTKAVELFVGRLALRAASTAALRGGKTVQLNDLLHAVHSGAEFDFLQLDFPRPVVAQKKSSSHTHTHTHTHTVSGAGSTTAHKKRTNTNASSNEDGKQSIKSFFSNSTSGGEKRKSREEEGEGDREGENVEEEQDNNDSNEIGIGNEVNNEVEAAVDEDHEFSEDQVHTEDLFR